MPPCDWGHCWQKSTTCLCLGIGIRVEQVRSAPLVFIRFSGMFLLKWLYRWKSKNNQPKPRLFQRSGKKGPIFPKKLGNRTTIPDNLIFSGTQSIGGFYETYRRLLRNFSNLCTRWDDHFKRPKARSHWMSYGKRKGTCVEIGKTTALKTYA